MMSIGQAFPLLLTWTVIGLYPLVLLLDGVVEKAEKGEYLSTWKVFLVATLLSPLAAIPLFTIRYLSCVKEDNKETFKKIGEKLWSFLK